MTHRITAALILSGLAFAAGCSNAGSGAALPLATAAEASPSWASPSGKHVRIREFSDLPQISGDYYPSAVAQTSGSLWVTDDIDQDYGENAVVRVATSGRATNVFYYQGLSTQGASFQDITPGTDGALWITDSYNGQIVRMTTDGRFTNFPLKSYGAPLSIAAGSDRALWFTMQSPDGPAIGRITTGGRIKTYSIANATLDITAGPDRALWFTEPSAGRIGRITTSGKVSEYANGITAGSQPWSIAPGPDGALWFTERTGSRIGRITTKGIVTEYSHGITATEEPYDLAAGPDGAMWFTEYETYGSYNVRASKIGRVSMGGRIREYSKNLDPRAGPTTIVAGPDGTMWFVESSADRTGRITL